MQVTLNGTPHELPDGAMLTDALQRLAAVQPFAVAINREFVPRSAYAARLLQDQDRIEVIRPITGG